MIEVKAEGYESFGIIPLIFSNLVIFTTICTRMKHFDWHLVIVCITKDINVGGELCFILLRISNFSLQVWLTRVYIHILIVQTITYINMSCF